MIRKYTFDEKDSKQLRYFGNKRNIKNIAKEKNNPPAIINSPILNPKIETPTNGLLNNNKNPMNNNGESLIMSLITCIL